jgi:hypothetical protein
MFGSESQTFRHAIWESCSSEDIPAAFASNQRIYPIEYISASICSDIVRSGKCNLGVSKNAEDKA